MLMSDIIRLMDNCSIGSNTIIQMALEDFGIDMDTYKLIDIQLLEDMTSYMISTATESSQDQMKLSRDILLVNRSNVIPSFSLSNKTIYNLLARDPTENTGNARRKVSFAKHVEVTHVDSNPYERKSNNKLNKMQIREKKWNIWAKEYEDHLMTKLCF